MPINLDTTNIWGIFVYCQIHVHKYVYFKFFLLDKIDLRIAEIKIQSIFLFGSNV